MLNVAAYLIVVLRSMHLSGLGLSVLSKTVYHKYFSSFSWNVIDPVYYPLRTGLLLRIEL